MATEEAQDILKEAADVMSESVNTEPAKSFVMRHPNLVRGISFGMYTGGVALMAGITGYLIAKRKFQLKFAQLAENEIAEARKYYSVLHKKDEFADPVSVEKEYVTKVESLNYGHPVLAATAEELPETDDEVVEVNEKIDDAVQKIMDAPAPPDNDFDYEQELKHRTETEPHILSQEEFFAGEKDYTTVSLTYYDGDDVLTDERDQAINEIDTTVGIENLQRFGHGSKDPNIVYIRNDRLEIDFEVARSLGKYVSEVLGFVEHTDRRASRKSRKARKLRNDDG